MAESNKNSLIRLLVIISIIIAVDIIGGFLIGTKIIIPMIYKDDELTGNTESTVTDREMVGGSKAPGTKIPLDSINLNPAGSSGEIFSCEIVLEVETGKQGVIDEINNRDSEIMDKLSTYLSFKTVDELNNPNNWEIFKKDMYDIVNSTLISGRITSLYIPGKIIQFN